MKSKKIGLVLSGGGARGAAYIGALKALTEAGISPYHVSGVSAGAVVGALFCAGSSPDEIREMVKLRSLFSLFSFRHLREGFAEVTYLKDLIKDHVSVDQFEALPRKLTVGAVNLNTGKFQFFDKGVLSEAVAASASIPLLVKPVKIGNESFVDGSLPNNLPVEPLIRDCDFVIGITVGHHEKACSIKGWSNIARRSIELVVCNNTMSRIHLCDFVIDINANQYGSLDFNNSKVLFEIGYQETRRILPDLLKRVSD